MEKSGSQRRGEGHDSRQVPPSPIKKNNLCREKGNAGESITFSHGLKRKRGPKKKKNSNVPPSGVKLLLSSTHEKIIRKGKACTGHVEGKNELPLTISGSRDGVKRRLLRFGPRVTKKASTGKKKTRCHENRARGD